MSQVRRWCSSLPLTYPDGTLVSKSRLTARDTGKCSPALCPVGKRNALCEQLACQCRSNVSSAPFYRRIGTQRGGDTCLDSCSCWAEKVEFIFLQNCALNHWTLLGPQNRTWPPVSFSSRPVSLQSSHGTSHWLLAERASFAVGRHAQASHQERMGLGTSLVLSTVKPVPTANLSSLQLTPIQWGFFSYLPPKPGYQARLSLPPLPLHIISEVKHPGLLQ